MKVKERCQASIRGTSNDLPTIYSGPLLLLGHEISIIRAHHMFRVVIGPTSNPVYVVEMVDT
jgi:hypothetical protein